MSFALQRVRHLSIHCESSTEEEDETEAALAAVASFLDSHGWPQHLCGRPGGLGLSWMSFYGARLSLQSSEVLLLRAQLADEEAMRNVSILGE